MFYAAFKYCLFAFSWLSEEKNWIEIFFKNLKIIFH